MLTQNGVEKNMRDCGVENVDARIPRFIQETLAKMVPYLEKGQLSEALTELRSFKALLTDSERFCSGVPINLGLEHQLH